ncbi:MAG: ExbD/TolR family protein [Verrucomicrobiales bacterium]
MRFYQRQRRSPVISIVPLIDILTILLIFFIVTTTFRTPQPQININLPESPSASEAASPTTPLVVFVTEAEEVFLGDQLIATDQLAVAVQEQREANPDRVLALQADRRAPFEIILQVMDALKAAGVREIPAFTRPTNP